MSNIAIIDLTESNDLDRQAMQELVGGYYNRGWYGGGCYRPRRPRRGCWKPCYPVYFKKPCFPAWGRPNYGPYRPQPYGGNFSGQGLGLDQKGIN